jgi:hypothetical protein
MRKTVVCIIVLCLVVAGISTYVCHRRARSPVPAVQAQGSPAKAVENPVTYGGDGRGVAPDAKGAAIAAVGAEANSVPNHAGVTVKSTVLAASEPVSLTASMADESSDLDAQDPNDTSETSTRTYFSVKDMTRAQGPYADAAAIAMLNSVNPSKRLEGAAMLSQVPELDAKMIAENMASADDWLQFSLLGWLRDAGRWEQASAMAAILESRGLTADSVVETLNSHTMDSPGVRAALDWLQSHAAVGNYDPVYSHIALDNEQEVAVRLRAMVALGRTLSSDDYVGFMRTVAGSPDTNPGLKETCESLIEDLTDVGADAESREPVSDTPVIFSELNASDIRAIWGSDRVYRLQELVARIETVLSDPAGAAIPGTADELSRILKVTSNEPMSDDDRLAFIRLHSLSYRLGVLERTNRDLSSTPTRNDL